SSTVDRAQLFGASDAVDDPAGSLSDEDPRLLEVGEQQLMPDPGLLVETAHEPEPESATGAEPLELLDGLVIVRWQPVPPAVRLGGREDPAAPPTVVDRDRITEVVGHGDHEVAGRRYLAQ